MVRNAQDTNTRTNRRYIVGLFDDRNEADQVVQELKRNRFNDGDIDIIHHGETSGLTRRLSEHGVPDDHANYYAEGVRRGGHLVTVESDDDHFQTAVETMRRHGAVDINRRAALYKEEGFQRFDESHKPYDDREVAEHRQRYAEREDTLPVVEEDVHIGKERAETGGVRIFTRETERPVEKDVTLRDEHVDVERRNVDRPATDEDLAAAREGEINVRETSERPVVHKDSRVKEEVHVGKHAEEHVEHVEDRAKKRDVEVERTDDPNRRRK